ncbi:MAG TPA: ATP-dependent helicase C-terminal domain-containing protein, partial [Thermoanaerobaculia bacterium]|nr:ATP-dependent helicase C-terminal domain-containing protein [Thermoanaerobaculia bacterium]
RDGTGGGGAGGGGRAPSGRRAVMVGGRGVELAADSAVRDEELFVAVDVAERAGSPEALVRRASAVERSWLPPEHLVTEETVDFDPERERVVARRRTRYEDLVLEEAELPVTGTLEEQAARVLAAAAAAAPERALPLAEPEVASLLARLACLAEWMPELELPRLGPEEIAALLPNLARGRRSFAELRRAPLADVLRGTLGWERLQVLDREAPERLEVPSGNRVRLAYEAGRPPVLAVRLQELFGLAETPRVAAGRVPVLLHLLAPNFRPQQVTDDLASFWHNTYPQVRRELKGRYPKHAWPDDPLTAEAVRGARRRRSSP